MKVDGNRRGGALLALPLVALPFIFLLAKAWYSPGGWSTAFHFFLLYTSSTAFIAAGACTLSFIIAFPAAYLVSLYDFPLKKFFKFALILPLTVPAYIGAYAYHRLFDFSGPLNSTVRNHFGIAQLLGWDIFNTGGAIFFFGIFLYPYLYILLLSFFGRNAGEIDGVGRSLGASPLTVLFKLLLPLAKTPALAGLSMIAMEVMSDFGLAVYLGVPTLSAGIYKVWYGMDNLNLALKIAGISFPLLFLLLYGFNAYAGRRPIAYRASHRLPPRRLRQGWAATAYLGSVLALGFMIPVAILGYYSLHSSPGVFLGLGQALGPSLAVAASGTLAVLVFGLFFASINRRGATFFGELFSLQYALPGTLTALAVIILASGFGRFVHGGLALLRESYLLLIYAYLIRFIYLGYGAAHGAFVKLGTGFGEAALCLGASPSKAFFRIELPLIAPHLKMAFLYIFIDVFKELPLTLFLRPFNFSNLAVRTYTLMGNEMFAEGAPYGLSLIALLAVPIVLIFYHKETHDAAAE